MPRPGTQYAGPLRSPIGSQLGAAFRLWCVPPFTVTATATLLRTESSGIAITEELCAVADAQSASAWLIEHNILSEQAYGAAHTTSSATSGFRTIKTAST